MRIHHLNCGTHRPLGGALFDGASKGVFGHLCTHCLLLETKLGLILIDTGYGLQDVVRPHARLPVVWPALINVRLREQDTALRQIERLGYSAGDVRHIVLTHLDFDHAGGIEDFPQARVHVLAAERDAAERTRRSFVAKQRYRPRQWDSVRDWRTYAHGGETWFGFEGVHALEVAPLDILMVPLRGHTLGHAGVAIRTTAGWKLHAGDAYLHSAQMADLGASCPAGLAVYQHIMDSDRPCRRNNQHRLRALKSAHGDAVTIFCSHDAYELQVLQAKACSNEKRL